MWYFSPEICCNTPGVCACVCVSIHARALRRWGYEWAERGVLSKAPSRQWDECYLLHCTSAVLRRRKETEEKEVSILIQPRLLMYVIRRRCRCACSVVKCGRQPRFTPPFLLPPVIEGFIAWWHVLLWATYSDSRLGKILFVFCVTISAFSPSSASCT